MYKVKINHSNRPGVTSTEKISSVYVY